MARRSFLPLVLTTILATTACPSKDDASAEPRTRRLRSSKGDDDDHGIMKSDEEKMISYLEDMAELLEANKDDCDAMAKKLTKFQESRGREAKKLEARLKAEKGEKAAQDVFKEKYAARMEAATKKMMAGLMNCSGNDKVMQAMKPPD